MRYRVINEDSHYAGRQAGAMDMDKVREEVGMGRTPDWYEYWDVLLDFHPFGVGFKWDELDALSPKPNEVDESLRILMQDCINEEEIRQAKRAKPQPT